MKFSKSRTSFTQSDDTSIWDLKNYSMKKLEISFSHKTLPWRCLPITIIEFLTVANFTAKTNPLTPMSDQDRISPHKISRQVMIMKKGIISWSNTKFPNIMRILRNTGRRITNEELLLGVSGLNYAESKW